MIVHLEDVGVGNILGDIGKGFLLITISSVF